MSPNTVLNSIRPNSEEIKNAQESYRERMKQKRREAFDCIANAVPDLKDRLTPFFNEELVEINWRKAFQQDWSSDEVLTLQWLRTIWEQKMYVKPEEYRGLFPSNWEMMQAIFCALACSSYASHLIDDYFLKKYGCKLPMSTSKSAVNVSA